MAWLAGLAGALEHGAPLRAFWVLLIVGVAGGGAVVWGREDRARAVEVLGWALLAVAAAGLVAFGGR